MNILDDFTHFWRDDPPATKEDWRKVAFIIGATIAISLIALVVTLPTKARAAEDDRRVEQSYVHHRAVHRVKRTKVAQVRRVVASRRVPAKIRTAAGVVMLPHPPGCPSRLFCGCGAAVELFGSPIRSLWLSTAWYKFPRTAPAPNTVAVRRGHVFVLKRHIQGNVWLAADYNSGGRKSRLHPRSIAGYTIVNPRTRMAMVQ